MNRRTNTTTIKLGGVFGGVAAALFLGASVASAQQMNSDLRVTVDREAVPFVGQQPVEQDGRVLVPLRGVLEKMGAFVRYDSQTKTVVALRGATRITLPVNSRQALVGEKPVSLDVPARIVNGSTMVPLRFVAESLGAQVSFDVGARTVAIATGTNTAPAPPTGSASSAIKEPETVTGVVTAIYPNLAPRRVVVRVDRGNEVGQERTIPLRGDAAVAVRRPNGQDVTVDFARVNVGDAIRIRQTGDGAAQSLLVTRRTDTDKTNPTPRPNAPATAFRGEFLDSKRLDNGRFQLKMTDGRTVEVNNDAVLMYDSQKVTFDDLRSGDNITVTLDPRTGHGTRVMIGVEK
jgi:hypothetical protein